MLMLDPVSPTSPGAPQLGELVEGMHMLELGQGRMESGMRSLELGQQRVERLLHELIQGGGASLRRQVELSVTDMSEPGEDVVSEPAEEATQEEYLARTENGHESVVSKMSLSQTLFDAPLLRTRLTRNSSISSMAGLGASLQNLQLHQQLRGSLEELEGELSRVSVLPDNASASSQRVVTLEFWPHHSVGSVASRGEMRRCIPVLLPHSTTRLIFDLLSLAVLSYELISVPYLLVFPSDADILSFLSYMSLTYWIFDIAVSFRTGFYAHGELDMNPRHIALNYMKSGFLLDVFVVMIDIAAFIIKHFESSGRADAVKFTRIFKVSRLIKLAGAVRIHRIRTTFQRLTGQHMSPWLRTFMFFLGTARRVLFLLWLCHLLACLWCFVALEKPIASDTHISWIDNLPFDDFGGSFLYSTAFQWALTQLVCGSMEVIATNTVERVFTIVCLLTGLWIVSSFISNASAAVTGYAMQNQNHVRTMSNLSTFLEKVNVNRILRLSVYRQLDAKLRERPPLMVSDLKVLSKLSMSLRNELFLELCDPYLLENPFFNFLSVMAHRAWQEVCRNATSFSALATKDTLFLSGQKAKGMHLITKGSISYFEERPPMNSRVSGSIDELARVAVPAGSRLAEAALWCEWRHAGSAEVVSASYCEVLSLDAARFLRILGRDPTAALLMWAYGRSFLLFLKKSAAILETPVNDLDVHFGVDEVIAAMPRCAAAFVGQVAFNAFMLKNGARLPSALVLELAADARDSRCTLVVTRSGGVSRSIQTVRLHLTRPSDGQVLVCLRLSHRGECSTAACELPEGRQETGEHADDCLQRLLDTKLRPVAEGLNILGVHRESSWIGQHKSRVPTRCVCTEIRADWQEEANAILDEFLVGEEKRWKPEVGPMKRRRSFDWGLAGSVVSRRSSPPEFDWAEAEVPATKIAEIFSFPDGDIFAWLTEHELEYFSSHSGQKQLVKWMLALDLKTSAQQQRGLAQEQKYPQFSGSCSPSSSGMNQSSKGDQLEYWREWIDSSHKGTRKAN